MELSTELSIVEKWDGSHCISHPASLPRLLSREPQVCWCILLESINLNITPILIIVVFIFFLNYGT